MTLSCGRGFTGAAVNDVTIVDLAQSDADRRVLQRAAHDMGAWWLSEFLLLDSRTINFGAVGALWGRSRSITAR